MEKLRSYINPDSRLRPEYAKLTQSTADEHDGYCPHCGHVQNEAPQALPSSIARSWLALWTIATLLFGVLIVFILLLAKQYTFHCSLVTESSCPNSPSLLSDQAFSESAFKSGRGDRDMTDTFAVPLRRVVWKVEQGFVDSDPFDGAHWGNFGDEMNETAWTPWDDIYDGERLHILTPVVKSPMLMLRSGQARGSRSSPTKCWAFPRACQSKSSPWKLEERGTRPSTATLPASITKSTAW